MSENWQIGDRIGGLYEIREILGGEGKSGMGVVFICYYPWHQKLYALKTYQNRFAISEKLTSSFYKEAMLWMGIENHPNIIHAHWVHQFDGRIYIVMEYIPRDNRGRLSLASYFKNAPLPLIRTLIWAIQFCYGMEYASARGIKVHRDIKPDNILITLDKILKITDFGLSKAFDEEVSAGEVAGTPYWMSPEQFEDAGCADVRSDVYSFGIVLYQMASGNLPFMTFAPSEKVFFQEIYKLHKYAPVPKINSEVFPIIERCMAKNPGDRYADFSELRKELENLWVKNTDIPLPRPLIQKPFGYREINQKGVALKHLGKPADALVYHDNAIEENPVFANAWNDRGVALWELGKQSEAMECFNKAIDIDHEFVHPRSNKAGILSGHGKNKEAIDCYDEALKIEPEFINLWKGKGDVLLNLKDYNGAIYCYEQALKINRRDGTAWYKRGLALYLNDKDNAAEAMECAKNAIDINPFFYPAYEFVDRCKNNLNSSEEGK